jgi:DNA-nicking Smr family endonuclease
MKRRTLTREEKALWAHVQRGVAPFPGRVIDDIGVETPGAAPAPVVQTKAPKTAGKPPAPVASKRAGPPPPPPLAPFDRRTLRRIRRGGQEIGGALDLHGLTQAAAHHALVGFLRRKQAEGAGLVIVVTGKGGGGGGGYDQPDMERGVLRRVVPHWLRLADLGAVVLGFETAAQHHGGEGALYVRLRRARGATDAAW